MNIPIDFGDALIQPLKKKTKRCAVATIRYSAVDPKCQDGVLVYIKPILLGTEPPDVGSYAVANPTFPHQTTADQWFNVNPQTESYRMLGIHTIDEICGDWKGNTLDDFAHQAAESYLTGQVKSRSATA